MKGYLTPSSIPPATICRRISFPDSEEWLALVTGMISSAIYPFQWQEFGTITPNEAAERCRQMLDEFRRAEGCMLGAIVEYATIEPPPGCLPCDGSIYNRVDYPDLWQVLQPQLKIDSDTFMTPDLRDKFTIGQSDTIPFLTEGGESTVSLTDLQNGVHTHDTLPHSHLDAGHAHSISVSITTIPVVSPGELPAQAPDFLPSLTGVGFASIQPETVIVNSSGEGQAHNNMPPYVSLPRCLVAK